MDIKIIYTITIAVLFIIGILLLTLTEIFTEIWGIGLALIGIAIVIIVILTIKKFR